LEQKISCKTCQKTIDKESQIKNIRIGRFLSRLGGKKMKFSKLFSSNKIKAILHVSEKTTQKSLSVSLICILLVGIGLVFFENMNFGYATTTPNYYMAVSGSEYQMLDSSQSLLYQSTNSSQVFSDIIGNCSTGFIVYFENGTYNVTSMWTMLSVNDVTLDFAGGSLLAAVNGLDTSVLMVGEPDYRCDNITVNGITINGNAANQVITYAYIDYAQVIGYPNGISISGSNDEIDFANITNCRVMGVSINWCSSSGSIAPSSNSGVVNSNISNCGWNGVTFYGGNTSYLVNSQIYGCSDGGVSCTGGSGNVVTGNYIHDMNGTTGSENSEVAVAIEGVGNDVIYNNTIYNSCIGICNEGYSNNNISNNTISVSPSYYVSYGSGGSWAPSNPVVFHETWGMILNGNNDIVTDNTISAMLTNATSGYYNTGGDGIWLVAENSTFIGYNDIFSCQAYGVYTNYLDTGISKTDFFLNNIFSGNTNSAYYAYSGEAGAFNMTFLNNIGLTGFQTLNVTSDGKGVISETDGNENLESIINVQSDTGWQFPTGDTLTITDTPNTSYIFGSWLLNNTVNTSNPVAIVLTGGTNLTLASASTGSGGGGGGGGGGGITQSTFILTVTVENGTQLLPNIQVTCGSQNAYTNQYGVATFQVVIGSYTVSATYEGITKTKTINITPPLDTLTPYNPSVTLNFASSTSPTPQPPDYTIYIVIIAVIALVFVLLGNTKKRRG